MKKIPLSQGMVTLVDNEDFESLSKHKWHVHSNGAAFYAVRGDYTKSKRKWVFMSRQIMNAKKDEYIDHISGNTLDNRKENLRVCNTAQNQRNRKLNKNSTSGFKGVWAAKGKKWAANIKYNNKQFYLGAFNNPKEAAEAYDRAAIKIFGEFAKTNKMLGLL